MTGLLILLGLLACAYAILRVAHEFGLLAAAILLAISPAEGEEEREPATVTKLKIVNKD